MRGRRRASVAVLSGMLLGLVAALAGEGLARAEDAPPGPAPGPHFEWVPRHDGAEGSWIPGHWKYTGPAVDGKAWVPGHYTSSGKWVEGHWVTLPKAPAGKSVWVPGHHGPKGRWVPGHWK